MHLGITPFALAERDRVSLGLSPGVLIPLSHAPDDLVSFVEGQTSFGTQRRPPIPLGRDHEGPEKTYLSDPMTSKTTIGEREKEEQCRNQLDNVADRQRFATKLGDVLGKGVDNERPHDPAAVLPGCAVRFGDG